MDISKITNFINENLTLIIIVFVILVIIYIIRTYNKFIWLETKLQSTFARMSNMFTKINNILVDNKSVIDGAVQNEKEIWNNFAEARSAISKAAKVDASDAKQASASFGDALNGMRAITESYPDIKFNDNFTALQNQISDLYEQGQGSQDYNNEYLTKWNNLCRRFPSIIVAKIFRFKPVGGTKQTEFFDTDKDNVKKQGRETSTSLDFEGTKAGDKTEETK